MFRAKNFSSLALRALKADLKPSSATILKRLDHLPPKYAPATRAFSNGNDISLRITQMMQEQYQREQFVQKQIDQILELFQIKQNYLLHNEFSAVLTSKPNYYRTSLRNVLVEMTKYDKLDQASFDKLFGEAIISADECIASLKEMKLYNKENMEFLFSSGEYTSLNTILKSFIIRHKLFKEDFSFEVLKDKFEFLKTKSDALPGIADFARAGMSWTETVELVKANEAELFNDKAYIISLITHHNKKLNLTMQNHKEIIKNALTLLNIEHKETITAIVKEIKSNYDLYQTVSSESLNIMLTLAKQNKLPGQSEHTHSKSPGFK